MFLEMAPNLSRNAILKGCVSSDFFCLVCEIYFTSSAKCDEHISGEDHKEKMLSAKYVEEFKEDFIVKIKNKYFCELCNILLPIFARVKLHIYEQAHIKKKYVGWLKRIDDFVIAFDTLMVDDTSWQGLGDNSCAICNMEYEDVDIHKNKPTHMLNLIQSEIQFDKNKNIYRKVDDNSIHCLTCNLVQTLDTNHFDSSQHKQIFQVACNSYKAMKQDKNKSHVHYSKLKNSDIKALDNDLVEETVFNESAVDNQELELLEANSINTTDTIENSKIKSTYVDDNKSESEEVCDLVMDDFKAKEKVKQLDHETILNMPQECEQNKQTKNSTADNKDIEQQKRTVLDSVDKFQKNGININLEAETAVCKKCLMSLDYDHEAIDKHILEHQKKFKKEEKLVPFKLVDGIPEKEETLVSSPAVPRSKILEKPLEANSSKTSDVAKDLNNGVSIATPLHNKQTKNSTPHNKDIEQQIRTVLDSVDKFQRNGININFEAQTVVCKKCSLSLDYDHEAIDKHIQEHQKKLKKEEKLVPFKLVDGILEKEETLVSSPTVSKPTIVEKPLEANSSKSSDVAKDLNNAVSIATPLHDKQTKNSTPHNKDSEQQKRTVLDSVDKFQRNGIKINFEAQTVVCKKCSLSLDYDHEAIDKHILSHQKQFKKEKESVPFKLVDDVSEEKETLVSSPAVLSPDIPEKPLEANSPKSSDVAKDLNNAASIATPLHIETPPSPKIKKTKETTLEKIPAKDFIKTIVAAKNVIFKDVIINNKFCVNHFSFCFVTFLVDRVTLNCFICDKNILCTEFESHNDSPKHETAMREALILTQCDQEFIREIRPGFYHCGYCNILQSSWSEMEKHLKTSFHIECKNGAFWRLQQYQPQISKNTDLKTIVNTLYANMITVKFL